MSAAPAAWPTEGSASSDASEGSATPDASTTPPSPDAPVVITALDTSVVVAALLGWHEAHRRAAAAVVAARSGRGRLVLPVPALVQSYSVMTRLPRGHRVSPRDALHHLRASFTDRVALVAPPAAWDTLATAVADEVQGGGIHDFEILRAAAHAGATRLLTLNPDDFIRFGVTDVAIVVP